MSVISKEYLEKARKSVRTLERIFIKEHAEFEVWDVVIYSFSDRFKDKIVKIKDIYVDEECRIVYMVQEMLSDGSREKKNVGPYPVWQENNELFKLESELKEG